MMNARMMRSDVASNLNFFRNAVPFEKVRILAGLHICRRVRDA
jgi:hypothetical protein